MSSKIVQGEDEEADIVFEEYNDDIFEEYEEYEEDYIEEDEEYILEGETPDDNMVLIDALALPSVEAEDVHTVSHEDEEPAPALSATVPSSTEDIAAVTVPTTVAATPPVKQSSATYRYGIQKKFANHFANMSTQSYLVFHHKLLGIVQTRTKTHNTAVESSRRMKHSMAHLTQFQENTSKFSTEIDMLHNDNTWLSLFTLPQPASS